MRCQFIADKPTVDESCKCGREAKPGSSYCPEHHVRCHAAAKVADAQDKAPPDQTTISRNLTHNWFQPTEPLTGNQR